MSALGGLARSSNVCFLCDFLLVEEGGDCTMSVILCIFAYFSE